MVRSMIAGVAGLKTHQSKLDVIGNNIANVNTWGFKSSSFNFQDSMYSTSINGSAGSVLGGGAGGRNASQVGYGVTTGSISSEFGTGAPAPSSNPLDCMIDGTGFFLVGNMVNGSFTNVADSGLNLSRVGIFRVDGNGYLVDDQRSYVYGYALVDGTGIPEKPAKASEYTINNAQVTVTNQNGKTTINIAGQPVETTSTGFVDQVKDWIKEVTKNGSYFADFNISLENYDENAGTANFKITAKKAGDTSANGSNIDNTVLQANWGNTSTKTQTVIGSNRVPGVAAEYSDELSAIQIPIDPDTGDQYEIQSYKINEDGTVMGVDNQGRTIAIGQLALITVENPNGLEKTSGY
ncbi:MAG: flagellar hook-basal body complex protein, partial [Lachnospiraceae bacterium]|nr:flagellar hook-basal body complex protein [Lachnospiraceae bacterium]